MFITQEPINVANFLSQKVDPSCGGVASFVGVVRNHHEGKSVARLYYECYETMANRQIQAIVEGVKKEQGVTDIQVIHRVGTIEVGEAAIAILVSAPHRHEAFIACRAVIDQIKLEVPIWKKETYTDGSTQWVLCSHHQEVTS